VGGGLPDLDLTTLLFVLAGYLAGSIPTGYWLVRALRGEDIRKVGSGNIGATNVWRTYGARLGAPVMALDVAKGFVPALLATIFVGHLAGVLAGGAAMLGHWRPVFMRFARGGKVVATCGGAFLGVAPVVGGIGAAVWILVFAVSRYASVRRSRPRCPCRSRPSRWVSPGRSTSSPGSPRWRCSSSIARTSPASAPARRHASDSGGRPQPASRRG